jgi:tocopherol O-methyltransferase
MFPQLSDGIANFYDSSSDLWERIWGEHMHHGYYAAHLPQPKSIADHQKAQVNMVNKVFKSVFVFFPRYYAHVNAT